MNDPRAESTAVTEGWRLRSRLALAFLAVAFVTLILLLVASLLLIRADVARSSRSQAASIAAGFEAASAASYRGHHGWNEQGLVPLVGLADSFQASLEIRDQSGRVVASNDATIPGQTLGPVLHRDILVAGSRIGSLSLALPKSGSVTSDLRLQRSLAYALLISGALAAFVALLASIFVAIRVARPVQALTTAAHALTRGNWNTRVSGDRAIRELNELGDAFNSLATSLETEDALRRTQTADIAHELRTPLAILQASTEAILDGVVPVSAESVASLHDETTHLSRVVEDLERLADAQAAGLSLEQGLVRLDRVAAEVANEVTPVMERANLQFRSHLHPVQVVGDERRLRQVVLNLVTNAAKFTAPGGRVELEVGPYDATEAEVVVSDTGRGIGPDDLERIFERFWRASDPQATPGSGIGLAIVKELVAAHHGTISVESELGLGSRFVVQLPRVGKVRFEA